MHARTIGNQTVEYGDDVIFGYVKNVLDRQEYTTRRGIVMPSRRGQEHLLCICERQADGTYQTKGFHPDRIYALGVYH